MGFPAHPGACILNMLLVKYRFLDFISSSRRELVQHLARSPPLTGSPQDVDPSSCHQLFYRASFPYPGDSPSPGRIGPLVMGHRPPCRLGRLIKQKKKRKMGLPCRIDSLGHLISVTYFIASWGPVPAMSWSQSCRISPWGTLIPSSPGTTSGGKISARAVHNLPGMLEAEADAECRAGGLRYREPSETHVPTDIA